MGDGPDPGADPFDGLRFDDAFVRAAAHREPSARQRQAATTVAPPPTARRRRRGPGRRLALAAVVLFGVAVVVTHRPGTEGPSAASSANGAVGTGPAFRRDRVLVDGKRVTVYPPPARGAADHPLGSPPPLGSEVGPFRFIREEDGGHRPVAYDPCRALHLVVDARTAPAAIDDLLEEAVAQASLATGLQIVIDEPTDEEPRADRALVQEDRYGDRWAPVLVSWSDPEAWPELAGDVAGTAGSQSVPSPSGGEAYVTGMVVLDGPQATEILRRMDGRDAVRAVIEHELGHLLGLDHVSDAHELMAPESHRGINGYGPGDRAGLAQLGTGPCFADL